MGVIRLKKSFIFGLVFLLICVFYFSGLPVVEAYGNGFIYSRSITIDHTKVPNTDRSNFPILVSGTYSYLATEANGGKVKNASGYDIGFYTNSNCSTGKMNWQTENYNATTGEVTYWIKVATISHSTDTVFYICYGNSSISTDQSSATSVWDSNYKTVYHFGSSSLSLSDSTSNVKTLTNSNVTSTTGKISGAASFNGTNSQFTSPVTKPSLPITFQFWVYTANTRPDGIFDTAPWVGNVLRNVDVDANGFLFDWWDRSPGVTTTISANTWTKYDVVYSFSSVRSVAVYKNGTLNNSGTGSASSLFEWTNFHIGSVNENYWYNGKIDEFRISDTARSADWLATEYNNQSSPATFYSFGTESSEDITAPTQSGHNPANSLSIADATQNITFTTNENATCRVSYGHGDESYATMLSNSRPLCTGGGTTSQTCTTEDLGSDGSKTIYIACIDSFGNGDAVDTNTELTYTLNLMDVFNYTGSNQTVVVPSGVNQITVKAWGAGGGGRTGSYSSYSGGSGGYAESILNVTPGDSLVVIVGGGGQYGSSAGGLGGYGGGGYGTYDDAPMGGGGGLSGVFINSYSQLNSLIIAGGGGGGGYRYGGAGGGQNGGNGQAGGYGGTQLAGGTGTNGANGSALQGGNGDSRGSRTSGDYDGGGGGGGYYGGEGGYADAGGGGGGSGYVNSSYRTTYTLTTGTNGTTSDVNPPNTNDTNYVAGVGIGKKGAFNGGNGLVVINFSSVSDTIAPIINSVSSDKTDGSYKVGEIIDIDVNFSEAVTSTGDVTVTLETGSTDRTCIFSVSNSTSATCSYAVESGDTTSDLTVISIGGTIADQSSNPMTNFVPTTNLSSNKDIVIDTTAPETPIASPSAGAYTSTQSVSLSSVGSSAIYYTNNGDAPTTSSTLYSSAITINNSLTIKALAVDEAGNESSILSSEYIINLDSTAPVLSNITVYTSSGGAVIDWTTNEMSSSLINYGLTSLTTSATSESNTSPRVTTHEGIRVNNLVSCTRYYYKLQSTDSNSNTGYSSVGTFKTAGCTGDSTITATGQDSATSENGGAVSQGNISLTIPSSFKTGVDSAIFQANKLDNTSFLATAGTPSGLNQVGTDVYTLRALSDETTPVSTFDQAITVVMAYSDSDVSALDESTLWIYRYDGSNWNALSGCTVNASTNTVACQTTNFSDFGIFGEQGQCSTVEHAATYNAYPTCGPATCQSGYTLSGGACIVYVASGGGGGGGMPLYVVQQVSEQNKIDQLKKQIEDLQAQIAKFSGTQTLVASTTSTTTIVQDDFKFTRDLYLGTQGEDVKHLQIYLNNHGFVLTEEGDGSPGHETDFFGKLTKQALIKLQKTNNIEPAWGFLGIITRGLINKTL